MLIRTALDIFWETPMPPLRTLDSPLPHEKPRTPAEPHVRPTSTESLPASPTTLKREQHRTYSQKEEDRKRVGVER